MKRVVLALMLTVLSGGAAAAWVRVGSNHDVLGSYAHPASIRKKSGLVKMTNLLDFRDPQTDQSIGGQPYLSQREQREYDCKDARYRLLRFSLHSGHMDTGRIVRSVPASREWSAVVPGSLGEALWNLACGRK